MRTYKLSIFILLLCLGFLSRGQQYSLRYLTVNEGLPSNETFALLQKESGELVIGTEYGVVYYDGEDFKQIPFAEPRYNGSIVLGMNADKQNGIWIKTYREGFFYLQNDTLRSFPGNVLVLQKARESTVEQFLIDDEKNIWFTVANLPDTVYKINYKGTELRAVNKVYATDGVNQFIYRIGECFAVVKTKKSGPIQNTWKVLTNIDGIAVIPPEKAWKSGQVRAGAFINHSTHFWLSMGNQLLRWDYKRQRMDSYETEAEIYCLEEDRAGNVLIGTRKGAFILLKKQSVIKPIFDSRIVHKIFIDSEKGYWFATNDGLVYMPSTEILVIDNKNFSGTNTSAIAGSDSLLAAAGTDKFLRLFKVEGGGIAYLGQHARELDVTVPKKMVYSAGKFIYGTACFDVAKGSEMPVIPFPGGEILDIEVDNNALLFAYKRGFSIYESAGTKQGPVVQSSDLFCRAICRQGGKIYLGSDMGLFVYTAKQGLVRLFADTLNYSVNDIKRVSKDEIVVATRAGGVFIIRGDNVYRLGTEQGLSSPFCSKIFVQNDTTFWVGTNKGLNRIYWNPANPLIDNWHTEDGLISDKINDLAKTGSYLAALTDLGINYFDINNISVSQPKIKVRPNEVRISGQLATLGSVLRLKPGQSDISFDFKVLGFKKRKNLQMVYVLRGKDQILSQTGGRSITYRDLSPGNYTLEVMVPGADQPLSFTIDVEPYFYQTTFFKVLLAVLLAGLIAGGIVLYLKRLEAGRRRKWEYSNAQLEALNMQINPHFLFNSLNNIQYLSFSREHKVLNRFISGLSELLRGILKNSKTNLIPLSDELKNIEHYLELEEMRFEDETFSYKISVDPNLELARERIPPMLVQPLVENAIWHGLLPKQGKKLLHIHLVKIDGGFKIVVEDNGIGISRAVDLKKPATELRPSLGLENVRRRLELYESMDFGKAALIIENLTAENNINSGTRATMMFQFPSLKHTEENAPTFGNN